MPSLGSALVAVIYPIAINGLKQGHIRLGACAWALAAALPVCRHVNVWVSDNQRGITLAKTEACSHSHVVFLLVKMVTVPWSKIFVIWVCAEFKFRFVIDPVFFPLRWKRTIQKTSQRIMCHWTLNQSALIISYSTSLPQGDKNISFCLFSSVVSFII